MMIPRVGIHRDPITAQTYNLAHDPPRRGRLRMTVAILISGSIFREPQERTSSSGKRYVVTTIKAAAADNASSDFWSALAFRTTAAMN